MKKYTHKLIGFSKLKYECDIHIFDGKEGETIIVMTDKDFGPSVSDEIARIAIKFRINCQSFSH